VFSLCRSVVSIFEGSLWVHTSWVLFVSPFMWFVLLCLLGRGPPLSRALVGLGRQSSFFPWPSASPSMPLLEIG
jgi:hypothetical protein